MGGTRLLPAGTRLGHYRIEAFLACGSTGAVYRATDERLDRRVALKTLPPWLGEDERIRERFLAEARAAASLDHPNILPVYDAGDDDGTLWIAMRLAQVGTLREAHRDPEGAVVVSRVVHREDVRVVERGRRPGLRERFLADPLVLAQPRRERLEGDPAIEAFVGRPVHRAGGAARQERLDPVVAEARPRGQQAGPTHRRSVLRRWAGGQGPSGPVLAWVSRGLVQPVVVTRGRFELSRARCRGSAESRPLGRPVRPPSSAESGAPG